MKNRVVVQAIVRQDDKVLLIRRSQGKQRLIGKYELPGGAVDGFEQPGDSIKRHLANDVGIKYENHLKIEDAFSMRSRDDEGVNYIVIVYSFELRADGPISLGSSYDKYFLASVGEIDASELRDSAQVALGMHDGQSDINYSSNDAKNTTKQKTNVVYSDGGSRGNPGPSAAAFVIYDGLNNQLDGGGEYIGITTNNQAEYHGVLLGLERAIELGLSSVEFRIDSMLVVNQLKGLYSIKNRELWPVNERIKSLLTNLSDFRFVHVPREANKVADSLVNKLLDEHGA